MTAEGAPAAPPAAPATAPGPQVITVRPLGARADAADARANATPAPDKPTAAEPKPEAKPAAATPADPAKPAPEAPKPPDRVAATLAEVARKEWNLRQEQAKFNAKQKEIEAKDAERARNDETWRSDPIACLEAHGHKLEDVIDFAAAGGAQSPEGKVRALEAKMRRQEEEREANRKKQDEETAAEAARADMARARKQVHDEVAQLCKDKVDDFELCSLTDGIADEVCTLITLAWKQEQRDLSVTEALQLCEVELDRRQGRYAQSKKLKAKFSQVAADGQQDEGKKPEAPRQSEQVPPANNQRTITIQQRQQAVAPARKRVEGRVSRAEVTRQVADNLATLFAKK